MSTQQEIRIGSEFVGYRIDDLIGRGGMGVVYRAYDLRLKRTVALKLMAPDLAFDQGFRERFSREAELAMSLEHPNVVPIHDAGDIDGRLYLAMRLVEGTDLRALIHADRPLDRPARSPSAARSRTRWTLPTRTDSSIVTSSLPMSCSMQASTSTSLTSG